MKKILVTGSSGSLGRKIVELLRQNPEYEVIGVDMYLSPTTNILCDLVDIDEFLDSGHFAYRLGVFDYVIHCAATIYGVAGFNFNDFTILSDDTTITLNLLNHLTIKEKFVYLSSSMVYERAGYEIGRGVKEDDVEKFPAPLTGYGQSKYFGESLVKFFCEARHKSYTIWRPFNIITPHEKAGEEIGYSHVFADFFQKILVDKVTTLPIIGDGYQVRAFTWIDDVARCIVDNLENPATDKQTFNIGNPEPISMRKLAQLIHDVGVESGILDDHLELKFETVAEFKRDVKYRSPDVQKARDLLGFSATKTVRESIAECVKEWKNRL